MANLAKKSISCLELGGYLCFFYKIRACYISFAASPFDFYVYEILKLDSLVISAMAYLSTLEDTLFFS